MTYDRSKKRWEEGDPKPLDVLEERQKQWEDGDLPPLDPDLLYDILRYSYEHDEPLPPNVAMNLLVDLEVALSGRDGAFFKKPEGTTKHSTSPYAALYQGKAVDYIARCKETGWDETYIKTVAEACGVNKSTVHRWIEKYPARPANRTKEELWEILKMLRVMSPLIKSE